MMDSGIECWTGPVEELALGQCEDKQEFVGEQRTEEPGAGAALL